MNDLDKIITEEERWKQEGLKKKPVPEEKSTSGIPLQVAYTPLDLKNIDFLEKVGFPGQYPFTRGVYPLCIGETFGPLGNTGVSAPQRRRTADLRIY